MKKPKHIWLRPSFVGLHFFEAVIALTAQKWKRKVENENKTEKRSSSRKIFVCQKLFLAQHSFSNQRSSVSAFESVLASFRQAQIMITKVKIEYFLCFCFSCHQKNDCCKDYQLQNQLYFLWNNYQKMNRNKLFLDSSSLSSSLYWSPEN